MNEPITVILVDDHAMVRQGVRAFLQTQPDILVVGEAGSGQEAVTMATQHAPDVMLMDLIMPGMDGVEATRMVKMVSPRTQIIVTRFFDRPQSQMHHWSMHHSSMLRRLSESQFRVEVRGTSCALMQQIH